MVVPFGAGLEPAGAEGVEVALPVSGSVVEDKRVRAEVFHGTARRLDLRALEGSSTPRWPSSPTSACA